MAGIRVILADDNLLVREGARRIIESDAELELAAVCEDLDSLLRATEGAHVVVTDIRMPPTGTDEGIQAAEHLRRISPGTGVIVLSQYADPGYALALLEKGSRGRGYLLKERLSDPDRLLGAIHDVAAGGSVIDPQVVDALVAARAGGQKSPLDLLTPREREILAAIAEGQNNAAIAATFFLSERAVEKHISSIFSKLGLFEPDVHRRVKAVLVFLSEQGG